MNALHAIAPEAAATGLSRRDGTVAFYVQVQQLARGATRVLDVGAGRGAWYEDEIDVRRELHDLRGPNRTVIGLDVDPIVQENPAVDEARVLQPDAPWPVDGGSIDLVVADWVLEHVDRPSTFVRELDRVLVPGGWFCARTTNAKGYVALGARLVPNRHHARVLRRLQPSRQERDVFPTRYRMNTVGQLQQAFDPARWEVVTVPHHPPPAYAGEKAWATRAVSAAQKLLPEALGTTLFVFARRRTA